MGSLPPLKGMHKKSLAERLLEVTPEVSTRRVAMIIADRCIEISDSPYRFAINHDIRPPKNLSCELNFDWTRKDRVGIDTTDVNTARRWLTHAAMLNYTLYRVDAQHSETDFSISIEKVRRRAEFHQLPKGSNDADIPF